MVIHTDSAHNPAVQADSPVEASPFLLLLEPDVLQLQWARDEADVTAFLHQTANPPVIVELLYLSDKKTSRH